MEECDSPESRLPQEGAARAPPHGSKLAEFLSDPVSAAKKKPRFPSTALAVGRGKLAEGSKMSPHVWRGEQRQFGRRPFDAKYNLARHAMFAAF